MADLKQALPLAAEFRRRAKELREEAERMEHMAHLLESSVGEHREALQSVPSRPNIDAMDLGRNSESRALKIAKTRSSGKKRDPAYQAILDAGMTPEEAAKVCGTSRDVLKQAWGKGKQFREIHPDWKRKLAKKGVPETVWRAKN